MNHVTIGVYPNDSFKVNVVRPEHLKGHIEYNKFWWFGRALFVDGKCVYDGALPKEQLEAWEKKIAEMTFDRSRSTEPYQ